MPPGLAVTVDGEPRGNAPLGPLVVSPGKHALVVEGHATAGALTTVRAEDFAGLKVARLAVVAKQLDGTPVRPAVFPGDWAVPGIAGAQVVIPACKLRLTITAEGLGGFMEDIEFEAGKALGVREALEPYQWWGRAGDVLPQGMTHVWHYNPSEFFHVYQEILEGMKPAPPPAPRDPETHGTLIVHVRGANGMPPKQAVTIDLSYALSSYAGEETDKAGTATFHGVPLGTYDVSVLEVDGDPKPAEVCGYTTTEVTIETALEGKPVQRGELTVWVRKATGGAAVGAKVTLSGATLDRKFGTLEVGKKSTVVFADLRGGDDSLKVVYPAKPAHPNERVEVDETVSFDGKKKKARITVPRGWGDVQVQHDDGGVPVAGEVLDEHGKPLFKRRPRAGATSGPDSRGPSAWRAGGSRTASGCARAARGLPRAR